MMKTILEQLLNDRSNDYQFSLMPYNPKPSKKLKKIFNHFEEIEKSWLYKEIIMSNHSDIEDIEHALSITKFYKGDFDVFDESLSFHDFEKLKSFCDTSTTASYQMHFYKEYTEKFLNNEIESVNEKSIDYFLNYDLDKYITIAKKIKIKDAILKIFSVQPFKVFQWVNQSSTQYDDLTLLNQSSFILQNMNGNLDITEETLKYVLINADPDINLYNSIKKMIGLEKLCNLTHQISFKFYFIDLISSLDDLEYIITRGNLNLYELESFLAHVKNRFPLIFEKLEPIMLIKSNSQYK